MSSEPNLTQAMKTQERDAVGRGNFKDGMVNLYHMFLARLKSEHLVNLLSAKHHPPYLAQHRLSVIGSRTRLVSVAFAPLTLFWIVFDAAAFPADCWQPIALSRVLASLVFIRLAVMPDATTSRATTLARLALMFAMPLMIYGVSQWFFAGRYFEGAAAIDNHLYDVLPIVVFAGLSIFPLVVTEVCLFAILIAAAVGFIQLLLMDRGALELLSTLWGFTLAFGIYLLACTIQLYYMMVLLRRANHDPLTGALTRRSGTEAIDLQFRIACDQDAPLSVLFIDIDDFKSINDGYGHKAGDETLKNAVDRLHRYFRQADLIVRWGGEEFLVVMVNTPTKGAEVVTGRLMQNWLGMRPDAKVLTASMGLAERRSDGVAHWMQLVSLADQRMYQAKMAGKACCATGAGIQRN